MPKNTRLSGHWLVGEGAAHSDSGGRIGGFYNSATGPGRAKCGGCGALSEVLPSKSARRRWGSEHKERIRQGVLPTNAPRMLGRMLGLVGTIPQGPIYVIAASASGDVSSKAAQEVTNVVLKHLANAPLEANEQALLVRQVTVIAEGPVED